MFFDDTLLTANGPALNSDDARRLGVEQPQSTYLSKRARAINECGLKRLFDVLIAVSALIFLLPALLVICIAIKIDNPGPILFRQERYGTNRRVFLLYKFRSMRVMETTGAFLQAQQNDTRITRVGSILRRTSLDELPQLFNVIRGEMSLVGPRPHAVAMDEAFALILPYYTDRHLVKPGLTGLAQVAGHRGPTEGTDQIRERLRRDRAYIRKWSVLLDLRLIAETPLKLLGPNAF